MGLWEKLRRPDWLQELQAVLIAGLVVVGALGVFRAVEVVRDPVQVEVPASGVEGTVDFGLRAGADPAADQLLQVVVDDPDLGQRVADALTSLPSMAVVVAMLALLLGIVWRARRSDPFTRATVRRLRVLAVVALVGGWGANLVQTVAAFHLSGAVLSDGRWVSWQPPLHWLLVGFGVFAVAEVVNRGCAMRADLETVI